VSASRVLLEAPGASFDEPFEMLAACHERIERMLTLLARLRAHVRANGCDAQAQQAARDVMRYFDLAAPQHHLDEELHVFPPLRARGEAPLTQLVERLQHDHRVMEARWQDARAVLASVAQGGNDRLRPEDEARLDAFASLYADHLRAEEDIAYPAADALLDAATRSAMGDEMARRRGAK